MRPWHALAIAAAVLASDAQAATHLYSRAKDTRRVAVVRTYEIPVAKGRKNVAAVPALMTFWGSTNQQIIVQSDFTYSLAPDKIEITADNRGMPRRNYELTWLAPDADKITVTQRLAVELNSCNTLWTAANLPYSPNVAAALPGSLAGTPKINPENPDLDAIVKPILARTKWAAEAVDLAYDWVRDNVPFKSGANEGSDVILKNRNGNCDGQSFLFCAILRRMGIPAEPVDGKFIGSDSGHGFAEVYFPDAGWVFYDLSNSNKGFKELDCLMTVGWAYRVDNGKSDSWHNSPFYKTQDLVPYAGDTPLGAVIRPTPKATIAGVKVVRQKTPSNVMVRHQPLSSLIIDLAVPPGKRPYSADKLTAPPPRASSKPSP